MCFDISVVSCLLLYVVRCPVLNLEFLLSMLFRLGLLWLRCGVGVRCRLGGRYVGSVRIGLNGFVFR